MISDLMTTTASPITASTDLTFEDYARLLQWIIRRQMRRLRPFAILAIACFLMAPILPYQNKSLAGKYLSTLPILFLPVWIFVVIPFTVRQSARKRWRDQPELHGPRTYRFSQSGIEIAGETFNSTLTWNHIKSAGRVGDEVILELGQNIFHSVPVRDFDSPESYAAFVSLVREKVADSRTLT